MSGFELHNPYIDPFHVDESGNPVLRIYDDGVQLSFDTEEISIAYTNEKIINLVNRPVGNLAISGRSFNGTTVADFYNYCASRLTEDIDNLDEDVDFKFAPDASDQKLSFYETSEITIIELAEKVSKAINYFFWVMPYYDLARASVRKKIVVSDINRSLFYDDIHKIGENPVTNENIFKFRFDDQDLIKIDIAYPYPLKSIETTLETNEVYLVEADEDRASSMMSRSVKIRTDTGNNFGNIESREVLAQTRSEARYWLQRFKEIAGLPVVSVTIKNIYPLEELVLGDKVSVVDNLRNVQYKVLIQEMVYDFNLYQTSFKGLSIISKISYS